MTRATPSLDLWTCCRWFVRQARELDEKEALARAEERMSLKHKNTSKWAKHVLRHGATQQVRA